MIVSAVGEDGEEERIRVYAKKGLGGGLREVEGEGRGEKGERVVVGGSGEGKEMLEKRVGEKEGKGGWGCSIC